nr:hypothetical protein [uncultured bacterium]
MTILIVNVGSTSLKFKVFKFPEETILASGRLEKIGRTECPITLVGRSGKKRESTANLPDYGAAIDTIIADLLSPEEGILNYLEELAAVGFKTVHAGPLSLGEGAKFLTLDVLQAMEDFSFVAMAHNPPYLKAIRTFTDKLPGIPMVGLFEPAFHATMPPKAYTYSVPFEWQAKAGIRVYGFHGASHRSVWEQTVRLLNIPPREQDKFRVVSCHLGGSSSLCGIRGGRSMDTTMGYSPQTGLPHNNRCETIDPFAVLHMMQRKGWGVEKMAEVLTTECGLKGISGLSGDVGELNDQTADNGRARLALAVFHYHVAKQAVAMGVACGGIDAIAFAGGIGERGVPNRWAICQELAGMVQVFLDKAKNEACVSKEGIISTHDSPVKVVVVMTNEELVVAREVHALLNR